MRAVHAGHHQTHIGFSSHSGKIGGFAKVGNGPSLEKGALDANSAKGKCEQPGFSGVLPDHSKYVKR